MEHTAKKMKKMVISGTVDHMEYVEMLVPENWPSKINTYGDRYGGYGYPYVFRITNTSEDETAAIYYYSPECYIDDHLTDYRDYQQDGYGSVLRHRISTEAYLKERVTERFGNYQNFRFVKYLPYTGNAARAAERKKVAQENMKKRDKAMNSFYYEGGVAIFRYTSKGYDRYHVAAGIMEAVEFTKWGNVPNFNFGYDPFMQSVMMSVYPNARYDSSSGRYIYTSEYQIEWEVRQYLEMDCLAEDYEYLYDNCFVPTIDGGIRICKDIWDDFSTVQDKVDARNKAAREEQKQVREIQRKAEQERRESQNQLYDYIRKTQQETHDILNSSYENTRKTQAKVSEMWSDTFRGDTRFTDRDGREHVIHTYNDYAYKKGDDYVTSDSPLDMPYDWERLEKKKY